MRHGRQVGDDGLPGDVLPQADAQRRLHPAIFLRLHHVAQGDEGLGAVGHFDANVALAGHGGLDADGAGGQGQGQVIGQAGDLADLDLRPLAAAHHDIVGFDAELGDRRPLIDLHDGGRRAEAVEGVLDDLDPLADGGAIHVHVGARFEHVGHARQRPDRGVVIGRGVGGGVRAEEDGRRRRGAGGVLLPLRLPGRLQGHSRAERQGRLFAGRR